MKELLEKLEVILGAKNRVHLFAIDPDTHEIISAVSFIKKYIGTHHEYIIEKACERLSDEMIKKEIQNCSII